MSWGEVKKALNTNIAKPLDTLITEAKNTLNTNINTVKSNVSTVNSNVNTIKTDVSSVLSKVNAMQSGIKKVQSGSMSTKNGRSVTVTIQSVNTSKSFVIVHGTGIPNSSEYSNSYPYGYLSGSTSLTVGGGGTENAYSGGTYVRWQVVEFY